MIELRRNVRIPPFDLAGRVELPAEPRGLVVFAHGSGSSRFSPRNIAVANALNTAGFGTLLFDLLRPEEERDRQNVFDIALLAERLTSAVEWTCREASTMELSLGLFGASTGAAAALTVAARLDKRVGAVVSRGGRPDLAGVTLNLVRSPTLLIVGGNDTPVIAVNEQAFSKLRGPRELVIVPSAGHLFSEPGALDAVISHATNWLTRYI